MSPAEEHFADFREHLLSAVTLGIRVAVHQRNAQHHPGVGYGVVITGSLRNP